MTATPLIACVPNFSEGRDRRIVEAILAAMHFGAVRLLDYTLDDSLNRSVVTILGEPAAVLESAIRGAGKAAELIDLTRQTGEHPRIGAADVIPFVPVADYRLEQCVLLARQAGTEIWKRFGIPSYFYEAAASRPDRQNLDELRRGQFEELREAVRTDSKRRPDIGGPGLHPTAGASAIGARNYLIGYNIHFNSSDVAAVRAIAREIRQTMGNGKSVKALGLLTHGRASLNLNISDYKSTPLSKVHAAVTRLANKHRIEIAEGEIVGILPEAACERESDWMRQLIGFVPSDKILERRLEAPIEWPKA